MHSKHIVHETLPSTSSSKLLAISGDFEEALGRLSVNSRRSTSSNRDCRRCFHDTVNPSLRISYTTPFDIEKRRRPWQKSLNLRVTLIERP